MEQEDRERLKRLLALTEKNHKMLRKMYTSMVWGRVLTVIYWVVIVGVAVGAFYFLQPILENVRDTYLGLQEGADGFRQSFQRVQEDIEIARDQIPVSSSQE